MARCHPRNAESEPSTPKRAYMLQLAKRSAAARKAR